MRTKSCVGPARGWILTSPRAALAAVLAVGACAARATDMEHKARVLTTVRTASAGVAEVTCDDPAGWSFDVSASTDAGRDVVTVRLASPTNAVPPKFGVFFCVPGAGVRNVWTSAFDKGGCHLWPKLWWKGLSRYASSLANETPIAVGFDSSEASPAALACSEALEPLHFGLYVDDRTCELVGRCEFFQEPSASRRAYVARVLFDRRGRPWYDVVRDATEWICRVNGFRGAETPERAYDPLYSTWYAYLQDVHADELEREARLAAAIGMKVMILDDGWQKLDSRTFYSATGDWQPVPSRFPDMRAHVEAVHRAGLKYMLWLAVPFIGDESQAWRRFEGKFLNRPDGASPGRVGVLDPRFPDVREYLISTYERVVGEWGFDGVKLDFIDSFRTPKDDPAVADGFAGRDTRSVPEAVDRLMRDVLARLRTINPQVLVEFRQRYMGPAIQQYGNMMRAADCPADPCANRQRICDLRLTSGRMSVHSDMLVWSRDETPEGAALPILNALFGTVQYSMVLAGVRDDHRRVMRHWIDFTRVHRGALLRGVFRPHHPEFGYPVVEAEDASERIVAAYTPSALVSVGPLDRTIYVVNATGAADLALELPAPATIELFDTFGAPKGSLRLEPGLHRVPVPRAGYGRLTSARAKPQGH